MKFIVCCSSIIERGYFGYQVPNRGVSYDKAVREAAEQNAAYNGRMDRTALEGGTVTTTVRCSV